MIKNNMVVQLSYVLKDSAGQELDQTNADQPFSYLHGAGQIVPGLEKNLEGLTVGDKRDVEVSPGEGYGQLDPSLKRQVERSNFPADAQIEQGMQFMAELGEEKNHTFTVLSVEGDQVFIDGNHPLAGKTLHFAVEVVGVRAATQEEMQHGHAHGPGGAHHH